MNKFLFKLGLFIALLTSLTYGLDYVIQEGLKKTDYREISKWNEVIEGNINAEILVIGSSRALFQFDSNLIEEKTGISCYNLGVNGNTFQVQDYILDLYLNSNKLPSRIYWIVDLHSFNFTTEVFRYEQFIPYSKNVFIDSILNLNQEINPILMKIPIIRFGNNPVLKYRGVLSYFDINREVGKIKKGFRMPVTMWDGKFDLFKANNPKGIVIEFDESIFNKFVNKSLRLKDKKIEIIWVTVPYYIEGIDLINNKVEVINKIYQASVENNIKFSNYIENDMSLKKEYFFNATHLNKAGVEIFMNQFLNSEFQKR